MKIEPKDNQLHRFTSVDTDTAPEIFPADRATFKQNTRSSTLGEKGLETNILGNIEIPNDFLPTTGTNLSLGWKENKAKNKLYYINYNSNGYHGWYVYDRITQAVTPILRNLVDTNGIDIMKLNPDYRVEHIDIIDDKLLYWVDALNKARKFNINKAIDKSPTGYGTVITEDFITAYKQCGVLAPTVEYFTDRSRTSNYLYGQLYKFAYRFYYDDGEISNWGDWSAVPLPPNESYLGQNAITFNNNCITVTVETGNKLVTKIEIGVKITDATGVAVTGLDWVSAAVLKKAELGIADYSVYTYYFYNDGAYDALAQDKVFRAFSFLPKAPKCQSFAKVAMTYTHFTEGFETVIIKAALAITFKPFYLPDGTVSTLNNPLLTANLLSSDEHGGIFNSWWTTVTHFVVGADVKKGNVFNIIQRGGNTSPSNQQNFEYTATLTDSAETVATKIKAYLRLIDAVGTGTISNESISGGGDVSWDFTVEAHESKQPIIFTSSVTPVNYSTLLDNGLSIPTIKQGATEKYGVVYEDDDGRTSDTYTADVLLAKTPFETDIIPGQTAPVGLQQPIHTISILNQPPVWAKYWRLVRTPGMTDFIQMLIQEVNEVVVANQPTYLDMVVGSLFTYQKIHPDTVIKYQFTRGDRLRLISNENTTPPTLYTPTFETEVLEYTINEQIPVNANIRTTIGTPSFNVTPSDGVKTGYVGKNIIIQDVERTIVSISGADYVLDQALTLVQASTPETYTVASYTIVDRRGILRIKKPTGITIVNLSKVEIYHPQKNSNDFQYNNFYDFQQKFPISNWGTPTRAHQGNIQNQDGTNATTLASTPAIVRVTQGDAYVRNRALPTNNANPNPQVIIDRICDPNFSDWYQSNLYSTGKVYPLDQGFGVTFFGSRARWSNNYIQGTRINGLNDFDNIDRKDYNDLYGSVTLTRFRKGYMFFFKQFKTTWSPVLQKLVKDNAGAEILATSSEFLNDLIYAEWDGGIGDNGESWFENGNHQYIASVDSLVFIRIAQDGSIPISQLYNYDNRSIELLSYVKKNNLRIYGGYDRVNGEGLWSIKSFINYIFNNSINAGDWQTVMDAYPDGTTWAVTQQPANSTATVVGNQIQITGTSTLGSDLFKFQGTLPDASLTPIMNFCFNVVEDTNRQKVYKVDDTTLYCVRVWGNDVKTGDATKNDCGSGYSGSTETYTVSANTYKSTVSQADADAQAQADVDANKQKWANDHGTCIPLVTYNSVEKKGTFQKDCSASPGTSGTYEEYVVVAGAYTSVISQADADNKAQADVDANGQAHANSVGTCLLDTLIGTLLVDYYNDYDGDICFYCHTAGTAENDIIVTAPENNGGTGVSRYPNDGRSPATCYLLSSNRLTSGTVAMRFGVNMAYFISHYPGIDHFTFIMRGRSVTAQGVTGIYALRETSEGYLIMPETSLGSGKYIPSVSGAGLPTIPPYSSNVISGANGTVGVGVGNPILQLDYVVSTNTLTKTTY